MIQGKPLLDIKKTSLHKYKNESVDALLPFEPEQPSVVVNSPLKLPQPLQQSLPGASTMAQVENFAASTASSAHSLLNQINRPSSAPSDPSAPSASSAPSTSAKTRGSKKGKTQRKRVPVAGKAALPKRKYRKKTLVEAKEKNDSSDESDDVHICCFAKCRKVFIDGERWLKCDDCVNWACPKCSKTEKLSDSVVEQIKFKCEKHRK